MNTKLHMIAVAVAALGIAGVAVSSAEETGSQPLTCTSASAVSLAPLAGSTLKLGGYTGVAYYTAETSGHQVVATIAPGGASAPIRFVSTLADGQNAILSVPQALGQPALEVEFQHCGDAVLVRGSSGLAPAIALVE